MEKFTIIIPTHNRPNRLRRIFDYYSGYRSGYNIIVADSSSDENKRKNKEVVSSLSSLKILYLDHYYSEIDPWHKFADAVNRVETKYCLFCADDDFVVPNGIEQSVYFFEKNEDFTVVHGQTVSFYPKNKGEFLWQIDYLSQPNIFSDAKSRLIEHLANYSVATFYGVHRTDFLKMIFRETLKSASHGRFIELLLTELTLVYGKMQCLNGFYSAREMILDSAGIASESINDLIKKGEYKKNYALFRECLSFHLRENSELSAEESGKVVDNAMSAHLEKFRPSLRKKFLMDILDYLPAPVSRRIQLIYRTAKLKILKPESDLLKSIKDPSSGSYGDFIRIRDCVASHKDIYEK